MNITAARLVYAPLTSLDALRRMRADHSLSFEDAWCAARLAKHPEEVPYVEESRRRRAAKTGTSS